VNEAKRTYKTLHFLGLETENNQVSLKNKEGIISKASFSEIDEIVLLKTDRYDNSGFLDVLKNFFFRGFMDQNSTAPERIYVLYIKKLNGEKIQKELKSFNLIGATNEVKYLNQEIVAQRNK
jgi:hypothetical protein